MTALSEVGPADAATTAAVHAAFTRQRAEVDAALRAICDGHLAPLDSTTADAVRYGLLSEGKRLRPLLVLAAYEAASGRENAVALATSIEIVHAYSLVHDDLPCMDDDDVRRGRPTVHRVYGVPAATAAGLAMVPLAARCALEGARALGLPATVCGAIVRELMRASGGAGMIGGQQLDLDGEGQAHSLDQLERIHTAKTGALITAAARIGGLAARTSSERLDALGEYGRAVGLAFQIADDVLDVTATTDELGKTAGRDLALQKSTYPALLGVDGAMHRARSLAEAACAALRAVDLLTPALAYVAEFSVARRS